MLRRDVCNMVGTLSWMPGCILRGSFGLPHITEAILGRPLNKTLQTYSWSRRPLPQPAERYAALDAWAAHECLAHLLKRVHPLRRQRDAIFRLRTSQ